MEGAGTTDTPQSYQFEDTDLPYEADSLAYRLQQVNTDGTESSSSEQALDVSGPVSGTYFLRMETDNGPVDTQRVTVVR